LDAKSFTALGRAVLALRLEDRDAVPMAIAAVRTLVEIGHLDAVVTASRGFPPLVHAAATEPTLATALTRLFASSRDISLGRSAGLQMPRELRRAERLSPREREVYELMIQGRTNDEIARSLFISLSTTKVHVRHIFEKLGVHSRAEAAAIDLNIGP
jgi:DNA-binding NarL/FixJ family response regulator